MNLVEQAKEFLFKRRRAYKRVFARENQDVHFILSDLAKFCRANTTTYHSDPRTSAALEGRREVWLRLQHHLQLTEEELWTLYRKD